MDFNKLKAQAEDLIEKRGGTDALKEDAEELKDIATGKGSVSDKAKAAAEALKDPGQARRVAPIRDRRRALRRASGAVRLASGGGRA